MKTISVQQPFNLKVVRFELDFSSLTAEEPAPVKKSKKINIPQINFNTKRKSVPPPPPLIINDQKRNTTDLVEALLDDLYADQRDWSGHSGAACSRGSTSAASLASSHSNYGEQTDAIEISFLESLSLEVLREQIAEWETRLLQAGEKLAKKVRVRDRMRSQQKRLCAAFSVLLRHITGVSGARFGLAPSGGDGPGEGGYAEWHQAMRLVARLPAGVPQHFRRKLWLTLSERHLSARGVDWPSAERACFRGTAQPDDTELGAQIIKDLHRTGCSLFCGAEGRENQGMLRRVLLAYARWNKDVGYCQGFNMLAAIILEVMDKSEADSLKVMIYLVEAVLPEGYFADDLRGLSADMAAFRDLLRLRLPRLAQHMDFLQKISDGGGVEPPLPDVFTMQWFLTLYATWLPRDSLLRIWDLVLLDGNEVLLLTALAIWDLLQDRILSARSADEFYSCMGGGVGAVWAAGDALAARVVAFGSAPELPRLRSFHRYRVAPPAPPAVPVAQPPIHSAVQSMTKRGLRLFYSEDEGDSSDDGNKLALATVIPRREDRTGTGDRLSLDIGALKRQYARLRERQRQAHVILAAACARHAAVGVPTSPTSLTVNNLLLGKSAIVSSRGRRLGPPPGSVPPSRQSRSHDKSSSRSRLRSSETISWHEEKSRKTLSRRNSVKWKDIKNDKSTGNLRKASIDFDETGDGTIVSEIEANQMLAAMRSRSSSETSSYSSHSDSSTDTSLCDENEKGSDSDLDLFDDDTKNKNVKSKTEKNPVSPIPKGNTMAISPTLVNFKTADNKIEDEIITTPSVVKDITDYLDSAAGEPLRTYIDEFDTKPNNSAVTSEVYSFNLQGDVISSLHQGKTTVYTNKLTGSPQDMLVTPSAPALVLDSLSPGMLPLIAKSPIPTTTILHDYCRITRSTPSPINIEQISRIPRIAPTDTIINRVEARLATSTEMTRISKMPQVALSSPYTTSSHSTSEVLRRLNDKHVDYDILNHEHVQNSSAYLSPINKTPSSCDYLSNVRSPTNLARFTISRPPDIIDSLTMYANFVPDIDLSDNTSPDPGSPPRSPGNESITISEDEPPIPLRIDKYFEHSPEFFGARVTDPNNVDIPNRRATKRLSRLPRKPESLTLQCNHREKILKEVERASSLPQSHSFTKKLTIDDIDNTNVFNDTKPTVPVFKKESEPSMSSKNFILKEIERASSLPQSYSFNKTLTIDDNFDCNDVFKDTIPKTPVYKNDSDKFMSPKDFMIKEMERASSLPQSHSFTINLTTDDYFDKSDEFIDTKPKTPECKKEFESSMTPKDFILRSGQKNSERALQIIQENSKILSRILTKQNTAETTNISGNFVNIQNVDQEKSKFLSKNTDEKSSENKIVESPLLKESTSDSLLGYRKRNASDRSTENHDFVRIRPISIDDPFSLESSNTFQRDESFLKATKSPSTDCLGNKTDTYGWVNKAFQAKCDPLKKNEKHFSFEFRKQNEPLPEDYTSDLKPVVAPEWSRHSFSGESIISGTLLSMEPKDTTTVGRRFTSSDCRHPLSNKYSDYVLSAASDICRKTINEETKACDNIQKTDESQASEFSQNVTSSISFTYEPSVDDDSLTGAKSNSSDTLCQITSLDQVSTPISPKIFPVKDTPTFAKDGLDRSSLMKLESEDTCSPITSLLETDPLSSLSFPRSPSTGSYHPFPTRPVMRMPKEIGVKLGLYPKDAINSAPK